MAFATAVRRGVRRIRRHTGAALILALSVLAASIVFAVADQFLFRPLPLLRPEELIVAGVKSQFSPNRLAALSQEDIQELSAQFNAAGAGFGAGFFEPRHAEVERLRGVIVTTSFFDVLGVTPAIGRTFVSDDAAVAGATPVVISYAQWISRLGGDSTRLNQPSTLGGKRVIVVGVMEPGFKFPDATDVWAVAARPVMPFRVRHLTGLLRHPAAAALPSDVAINNLLVSLRPSEEYFRTGAYASLVTVFLAGLALMAIAWLYMSASQSMRIVDDLKDIGVRLSLGATPATLVRQSAVESAALFVVVALLCAVLMPLAIGVVSQALPATLLGARTLAVDYRIVVFLAVVTAIGSAVVVMAQAWILQSIDVVEALGGRVGRVLLRGARTRLLWLASQAALIVAVAYVGVAGIRSSIEASLADLGFDPEPLLTAFVPRDVISAGARRDLVDALSHVPGVLAVAEGAAPLVSGVMWSAVVPDSAHESTIRSAARNARQRVVSASYLATVGIEVIAGRDFDPVTDATGSVILSRQLARVLSPDGSLVDRNVLIDGSSGARVVGVAADVLGDGPERPAPPMMYRLGESDGTIVVRLNRAGGDVRGVARTIASHTASAQPIRIVPEAELHREKTAVHRARAYVGLVTSGLALVVGWLAIWSAAWSCVRTRRREFAIRLAIGCPPGRLVWLVLRQILFACVTGGAIGLVVGFAATGYLSHELFGVTALDVPSTVAIAVVGLLGVALAVLGPTASLVGQRLQVLFRED